MHQLFSRAPSPTHCSQYLIDTRTFMKTLLTYQGIGIVVEVPSTNTGKNGLWWQRSCWFLIQLQSGTQDRATPCYWFCLGLSGHNPRHYQRWWWCKTILGWRCGYCLIPGNRGGSRFFKHHNASKALSHLTKGKDIVTCTGLQHITANVVHALTALKYSKANRKHDIAVQKNNLHEEEERQQDRVLGARIDRYVLILFWTYADYYLILSLILKPLLGALHPSPVQTP